MPNSQLKQAFESGKFVITAEAGPLKGTDISEIEEVAKVLKGKVDAVNVTDQQSSVMRLGSLATSHLLTGWGLEPIYQLTCRDPKPDCFAVRFAERGRPGYSELCRFDRRSAFFRRSSGGKAGL